jgi:hypothetical protein
MDELSISSILSQDYLCNRIYIGTFASNNFLPITNVFPAAYIINTDISGQAGSHWYVIYITKTCQQFRADIFDSLGAKVSKIGANIKMSLYGMSLSCNKHIYQSKTSSSCGLFCIFYIKMRSRGLTNLQVLQLLSSHDYEKNEKTISKYAYV